MPLITQEKGSLYGGVSQLDATVRLDHQVEEMVNCLPTIDKGVRLRNPSIAIEFKDLNGLTSQPTFPVGLDKVFVYEYDRGDTGLTNNTYAYLITKDGGLEIVDMNLKIVPDVVDSSISANHFEGTIYRDGIGINYATPEDKAYLTTVINNSSFAMTTIKDTTFVTNKHVQVGVKTGLQSILYQRLGYLWIKQAEASTGWKYGCTVKIRNASNVVEEIDVPLSVSIPSDTTVVASTVATNIATALGTRAEVHVIGSLIRIKLLRIGEKLEAVNAKDSFGDTASFGWGHEVDSQNQLPNSVGWFVPVVRVGTNPKGSFWITHDDGSWREYFDPATTTALDPLTMPRIIERRFVTETDRYEYFVEQYDWNDRLIGDEITNRAPSFVGKTIKDLVFFRNRLGFMTENSVIMSEVGFYGNFFRTSVAALLDSDRIDAGVESLKSINLEYSVLLEDSIVLFSDKAQFRFRGGQILSPASHEVTQELAYDVNIAVRPLFMDNKIFFVANRGVKSAIYEMRLSNNASQNSYASDLTVDCQTYIDGEIDRLTGSSVHKMVFASSHFDYFKVQDPTAPIRLKRNTVYVYNFYDQGNERMQSAWHKWVWNGDIYSAFALGTNFFTMIKRENELTPKIWILSTGEWVMDKVWLKEGLWLMSPDTLSRQNQMEILLLEPFPEHLSFLDNRNAIIPAFISFGEWMYGIDGERSPRGTLQFRTILMRLSEDSKMSLLIKDVRTNKKRIIPNRFLHTRKPYVGGNAKDVRISLSNSNEGRGFRLDGVSYEGTITRRARSK